MIYVYTCMIVYIYVYVCQARCCPLHRDVCVEELPSSTAPVIQELLRGVQEALVRLDQKPAVLQPAE